MQLGHNDYQKTLAERLGFADDPESLGVETELILVGPSRGDLQYRRRNLPKPMMS